MCVTVHFTRLKTFVSGCLGQITSPKNSKTQRIHLYTASLADRDNVPHKPKVWTERFSFLVYIVGQRNSRWWSSVLAVWFVYSDIHQIKISWRQRVSVDYLSFAQALAMWICWDEKTLNTSGSFKQWGKNSLCFCQQSKFCDTSLRSAEGFGQAFCTPNTDISGWGSKETRICTWPARGHTEPSLRNFCPGDSSHESQKSLAVNTQNKNLNHATHLASELLWKKLQIWHNVECNKHLYFIEGGGNCFLQKALAWVQETCYHPLRWF